MREILFRGKREDNGEWVEGFLIGRYDPTQKENVIKNAFIDNGTCFYDPDKVIPETVGEFTGHYIGDKRLFEGDIVKCRHCWRWGSFKYEDTIEEFFAQKIRGAYGKYVEDGYWSKSCYYYRNYVVEYDRINGGWRLKNGSVIHSIGKSTFFNRNAEIIGNITDNPELLN